LDLNLLSHNLLYDLMLEIPGTMNLKSDQAAYNLSYLTLLTGGASGSVQLVNPDMTFQGTKIKARTVNTEIDIDDIYNLKDSSGTFSFNASKMDVSNLNFRSIPIPINSVQISGVRINAVITKGNLKLDGSRVKADVFDIQFRGGMRLNRSFNATVFNLNVCINPVKGSNFEASDLFGFYVSAGGSSESGMCFLVTGSPASPSFVRQ
ncbi:MAG: hypothetical protein OEZ34_10335, partial [Spirochaetia bacterium]|nr:hypothetical protein [Spirochaetia bacterium]